MNTNSQNQVLSNYLDFVSSSQNSINELLSLIRQQDNTFQNILIRHHNLPSTLRNQSIYNPSRSNHLNINNRRNSLYNSHSSGPYSVPSSNYNWNNLLFRNFQERTIPRQANISNTQNPPSLIQILRATETKLYSSISDPVNSNCPISQEEFSENQEVIQIKNCLHIFKPDPLLRWFSRNSTCPYCRYDIRNFNNIDLSNNNHIENTSEINIENETTNNTEIIGNNEININNENSNETMVQTISRLITDNIRDTLNNENEEFYYTIVSQRFQNPETRE